MAISRNMRRQRAKVRQAIASTDAHNTAAFIAKAKRIRANAKALGKLANRQLQPSRGLVFDYSPAVNPFGFTRPFKHVGFGKQRVG